MPIQEQEARSYRRLARPSSSKVVLWLLALLVVLLFVVLMADLIVPLLLLTSDTQWVTDPIVPTIFLVANLLQLALLVLVPIVGILTVRQYPTIGRMWRIAWAFWGYRLFLASGVGAYLLFAWLLILNLQADPYSGPVSLPSWASPLGLALVVLCIAGCVIMIPELIRTAVRGARASGAAPRTDR